MKNIAIIGHIGALSKNILELLALRGYSKENVSVFETKVAGNIKISFGEEDISVTSLEDADFTKFDAAVFTGHSHVAAKYAPKFALSGVKVINTTSAFDGDDKIPVIVGGINDEAITKAQKNIINVPNAHIATLLGALAGIHNKYQIKTLRVSSYVAADYEGQDGMSELYNQTRKILMNDTASSNGLFNKTLAFNVIPQVGSFIGEETFNEWAYNSQIKQILGGKVKVHANCAFVPAFVGVGQFANIETLNEIDAGIAADDIKKAKGVLLLDKQEDGGYVSLTDVQGESSIFVSRIRQDMTVENGISLWVAGDVYKIAAQNILAVLKQFIKQG